MNAGEAKAAAGYEPSGPSLTEAFERGRDAHQLLEEIGHWPVEVRDEVARERDRLRDTLNGRMKAARGGE